MSFDWNYALSLLSFGDFWTACLVVVALSLSSWLLGNVVGIVAAFMKESRVAPVRWLAAGYVWLFRSLPLLVLLVFVYNLPQMFPGLADVLSSAFVVGLISLVLSEGAYMAEIHRGGLLSVRPDQREAAQALGLRYLTAQRLVVLPQAFRVAIPSLGNELTTIIKLSSLVSTISLTEILLVGQRLYTDNFKVLETMLIVAFYYVLIVSFFDVVRRLIENRLDVTRRKTAAVAATDRTDRPVRVARPRREHTGSPVVRVEDVDKSFGDNTVLSDVDLDVHEGEVVVVIGPSGSGKTTLLRTLNHLESVDAGRVEINGALMGYKLDDDGTPRELPDAEVSRQRREVGMVFQRFNLFPHRTAVENVLLAPTALRLPDAVDRAGALDLLERVGLREHADKYPHQLSGGQQQRVAIARAIAMNPKVLLFDEPTSALDPELVGEVLGTIADLADEGRTMVVVTHEMRLARDVADWVVFMEDGRVVAQGPPDEVLGTGATPRVARFLQQVDHTGPAAEEVRS
ncbi:polar amino acid transport system permease protein [Prauserella aidingensis]|nr:polar amino acid transport system permease protein [Prauserella aidingensis]